MPEKSRVEGNQRRSCKKSRAQVGEGVGQGAVWRGQTTPKTAISRALGQLKAMVLPSMSILYRLHPVTLAYLDTLQFKLSGHVYSTN